MSTRLLTPARDAILQRRYAPGTERLRPVLIAMLWPRDVGGALQMLQGHASQARTRAGVLYNRRIRLVRRFRFSAFHRRA